MKKTILSIAVIAAAFVAASCQKENLQENTASEGSAPVFTATIETEAGTKTTVERVTSPSVAYKTKWESTDQISINGVTYTATPDVTDATQATFTTTSGSVPTATFKAYFPANMYSDSKAILLASYPYTDGKYNMPMYAQSETTSLSFKNLCGVLAITVNGTDFTSVSSIEVSSDKQMNGEFTATADGVLTFASASLTDALKKVTLTFASPKTIESTGSATFYIPVPAGTHNPLTIKVIDGSKIMEMVTKKSGGVEVVRNKVYPIAFNSYGEADVSPAAGIAGDKVKWVQLWAGGPKFAEYNVGVTDGNAENYGGYYEWANDIVSSKWGSNWRMPTKAEFEALLSNCDVVWTTVGGKNGRKFTGKGAYVSNSVFLPAAGNNRPGYTHTQGNSAHYWSSTLKNGYNAYNLFFNSATQSVSSDDPYDEYPVRAVLVEED